MKQFGIIGLGVMGKNLAINFIEKGMGISVFNRHLPPLELDIAKNFSAEFPSCAAFSEIEPFVFSLEKPRKILLMVNAGQAVDDVIKDILPYLEKGDIILDGGNSHYKDTERRMQTLKTHDISLLGLGISGGEEGARKGPSLMPGGDFNAYQTVAPFLMAVAAKDNSMKPCCTYIGSGGAGHFVKMIHNGIEYAEMQLISEIYYLLKEIVGNNNEKLSAIFENWAMTNHKSYLLEITKNILLQKENGDYLLDKIEDAAEQKGTGGWTIREALDLNIPIGSIADAVEARMISSQKKNRERLHGLYKNCLVESRAWNFNILQLENAFQMARIINHQIGFKMMEKASGQYQWDLNLSEVARIWTKGCIIRSYFMEELIEKLKKQNDIFLDHEIIKILNTNFKDLSMVVSAAAMNRIALPVLSSSFNYFSGLITTLSPANLIQAQRDYFGAHGYKRVDDVSGKNFHTLWNQV